MIQARLHRFIPVLLCLGLAGTTLGDSTVPLKEAGTEWQLLGRAVGRVQTPLRTGTGFLIANDYLVTSAGVVEGNTPDNIYVIFTDASDITVGEAPTAAGLGGGDTWRVLSVAYVPLEGCANAAVLRLAPKKGLIAGELYGYLGARADDPIAGESAHVIAVTSTGGLTYSRADALMNAESGVCSGGGMLTFAYPTDQTTTGDGAPVLDDGGCLIGLQCASGARQALAININHLRQMMPDGGCSLETCMLEIEHEYHFDSISGTMNEVGGLTPAWPHGEVPRFYSGGGGMSDTSSAPGVPRGWTPPFDYPDPPAGREQLPPPERPTPQTPDQPTSPDPPDDPRKPVPEPTTFLLLVGAAAVCRSWWRGRD